MKHLLSFIFLCLMAGNLSAAGEYKTTWMVNHDTEADAYLTGTGKAEHYNVAIFVPADLLGTNSFKVGGFGFFLITSEVKNVKVWISKNLPPYGRAADLETVSVPQSDLMGWGNFNDIKFSQEYTVPAEGLYVGWSFDITGLNEYYSQYPMLYTIENSREYAFMSCSASNPMWTKNQGNAYAHILVGSDEFKNNAAAAINIVDTYAIVGEEATIPLVIQNQGVEPITSITCTVSSEGLSTTEETFYPQLSTLFATETLEIPVNNGGKTEAKLKTITITQVNGQPNESASNTASGKLITTLEKPTPVPVVEEFTGTWCGYCPYGIVGMDKAHKTFGDNAVLIAVHSGDPMQINEYENILNSVSGFPDAWMNRSYSFFPESSTILNVIKEGMEVFAPATMQLTATWTGSEQTAIQFDTETTFPYNDPDGHFALAYVLTADGLSGSGSSWAQSNYLRGSSGDSDMSYWFTAASRVYNFSYDHVAVAAWGIDNGLEGTINPTLIAGLPQRGRFQANLSANQLIQDKSKLNAIALLFDTTTGKIVQAAQTSIRTNTVIKLEDITELIDQYLTEGSTVTLEDITQLIDLYLAQ